MPLLSLWRGFDEDSDCVKKSKEDGLMLSLLNVIHDAVIPKIISDLDGIVFDVSGLSDEKLRKII